jgi:hypothetical protein
LRRDGRRLRGGGRASVRRVVVVKELEEAGDAQERGDESEERGVLLLLAENIPPLTSYNNQHLVGESSLVFEGGELKVERKGGVSLDLKG